MQKRYSVNFIGSFCLGRFDTISECNRHIRASNEYGFYQIVDNRTGIAVKEGERK